MMTQISLQEVTAANWRATLNLRVHPEQQRFIADFTPIAAIVLAKAYIRPSGLLWKPLAILAEQTLVGLLALAYQAGSSDPYWLYHFFIDHQHQSQGYGTAALNALFDLLRVEHPRCRALHLTVHPENLRAQRLYEHSGFKETGQLIDGEVVYRRSLSREGY